MKNNDGIDVTIIFVNYKTKDLTINAINSVIEKTEGIEYEIFVVDNASNDGSIEAIEQKFPNIKIIKSPINGGFGYANNLAIKQASGKYILCLNTDTLLINNAIKIMFDFMEENSNAGACGGQLYNKDGTLQQSFGYYPSTPTFLLKYGLFRFFYIKPKLLKKEQQVDFIIGADLFLRKKTIEEVGLFDEEIFMYGEEVDLCYRIKQKYYKIFIIPNSKITHFGGQSSPSECAFLSVINGNFFFINKYKTMNKLLLKFYYFIKYLFAYCANRKKIYLESISLIFKDKLNGNYNMRGQLDSSES